MKKLKLLAGIFLTGIFFVCLASCKNLIDTVDVQGYKYVITEVNGGNTFIGTSQIGSGNNQNDLETYYIVSGRTFSYEFIFANSGNGVTRIIVTGENESDREETTGTYSVYSDHLTLAFSDETITLSYNKNTGMLNGDVVLPMIDEDGFVEGETIRVNASFRAFAKVN